MKESISFFGKGIRSPHDTIFAIKEKFRKSVLAILGASCLVGPVGASTLNGGVMEELKYGFTNSSHEPISKLSDIFQARFDIQKIITQHASVTASHTFSLPRPNHGYTYSQGIYKDLQKNVSIDLNHFINQAYSEIK